MRPAPDREPQESACRLNAAAPSRAAVPIVLLSAAGFLGSAGARIVDPVLHAIAVDFSVAVTDLWVIIAAFTLPYGLNQILLGPIGDRFGKLRVMFASVVGFALFTGACASAAGLPSLVLFRALAGAAAAGIIPVGMAYIGDAVPYEQRQVTIGKFLTGIVLAQTMAGPLGGVFGQYLGWRGVFLAVSGLAILVSIGFGLQMRGLPDRRASGRMFKPENYVRMARHPMARLVLLAALIDGTVLVGCFPYLAPYLHERFGLPYAPVGLILACFGIGAYAYTLLARFLVPRLGEHGMVLAGGLLMAGALVGGILGGHWAAFIPVELMLGLGFFMLHGVLQAQATEMLPNARATAVATFACLLFLGQSLGALAGGLLIAQFGYEQAFLLDAAAIVALAVWLWSILRRPPSEADG